MKSKSITFTFTPNNTRSQASVTHLLDALLGKPPSPTCPRCGGITTDAGPKNGRCKCENDDKDQEYPTCDSCQNYVFMCITHNCIHNFLDPTTCGRFTQRKTQP